jgi:hypothetical protein
MLSMVTKNKFSSIALIMIIVGSLSTAGLLFFTPTANAGQVSVEGNGGWWVWTPQIAVDGIQELDIFENLADADGINGDGYVDWGDGMVNEHYFDWARSDAVFEDGELVGREIIIPGEVGRDTAGSTYTVTFANNNVTYLIESANPEDALVIRGGLGSGEDSFYTTLGSHFISYQKNEYGEPEHDPIFKWETNGNIVFENGYGYPVVNKYGQSLQLTHYAYAYRYAGFTSPEEFFTSFLKFIDEDKTRTDVFDINWRPTAAAPAPAPVYVRQTRNLTFAQSLYASDTLSDPDGQLRATVDQVMSKYGSLVK